MSVRKSYADGPFGQVHMRATPAVGGTIALVALHATAYSSQSFLPLMAVLRGRRQVIAIDAPGYGESDRPTAPPDIAGYAGALEAVLEQSVDMPVDILGYHTGAYMAAELAIQRPDLVRSLVLIGVPYFQALDLEAWRAKLSQEHRLEDGLNQFAERWKYFVTDRAPGVSLERAFRNFVDELKAWPDGSWAHAAMFRWDSDRRLPLVRQPVLILNPRGHLNEASRAAGKLMHNCTVRDMPAINGAVLETAAPEIGDAIHDWLSSETVFVSAAAVI